MENVQSGTGRLTTGDLVEGDAPESGAAAVEPGDVLFGKLRPYLAKAWLADRPVYASTELLALRPRDSVESRWLLYVCTSRPFVDWSVATSDGTKMPRTSWERLGNFRVSVPTRSVQREIAEHLDGETARIDALIDKKRRMIALLSERSTATFARALEAHGFCWGPSLEAPSAHDAPPSGWRIARLSVVLDQLTNGYVGPTRDVLAESGVRYIQSLHIKNGKIDFARRPYYVPDDWHAQRPRIHLRSGDVLIVQTGDIGQVAVVPPDFGPASCHALQIARVRADLVAAEYLGAYLRSPFGRQSLLSRVTGALHPHLEGGIRDIPIVVPPVAVQYAVVASVCDESRTIDRARSRLEEQIDLLRVRRQSLVTAAVTGQLDLPTRTATA